MLEDLPIRHDPLVVGDEIIANRGRRDRRGEESRKQDCVPGRYSHSIVAGGFELTS